jgi:hypothetical protein
MRPDLAEISRQLRAFCRMMRDDRPPRFAYVGGFLGQRNLGDEAFVTAYRELFSPASLSRFDWGPAVQAAIRVLRPYAAALYCGGTLINAGIGGCRAYAQCASYVSHRIVFGAGVRDPRFWTPLGHVDIRREWSRALDGSTYIGVRGPRSAELLAEVGVDAEVIGDPALAFFQPCASRSDRADRPFRLGLNVGTSHGNVWGEEPRIELEFAHLARLARHVGWEVRWYVVWPEDLEVARRAAYVSGTDTYIVEEYGDAHAYMDAISQVDLFVGMKLHAVILAICRCVPCFMVEYRPKCRDFMLSINQGEACVRSDVFSGHETFDLLQEWAEHLPQRVEALSTDVGMLFDKQRRRAKEVMARVMSKD